VSEDGTVSYPTDSVSTEDLPEDDPLTPIDEEQSARSGGVSAVRIGYNQLWTDISNFYTTTTPVATAQLRMKQLYKWVDDAAADTFVSFYYINRDAAHTFPASWASTLDGYLYCKGLNKQSMSRWALDTLATYPEEQSLNLITATSDEQISDFYNRGLGTPSTLYKEYSCVPSPTEVINYTTLGVAVNSQTAWKNSHRLLFTVENYFTDSLGNVVDYWWYDAVGVTAPANRIASVNMQLGTGITKPTINQVPFASNHKYQFTIDTPAAAGSLQVTIPATGMTAPITPSVAGVGIKITIEDLGEILI